MGFPGGSGGKESTCRAGGPDPVLGSEAVATRSSIAGGFHTGRGSLRPGRLQFMGCRESEMTERVTLSLSRKFYAVFSKLPLQCHMCAL